MIHQFSLLRDTFPPQLLTFFAAMLPVTELRGAIPFGMEVLNLSASDAFFWATLGNMVPNFIILLILEPLTSFLRKYSPFFDRVIGNIFEKTRAKHSAKLDKYGAIFLILFVAIPIPGSGSWSASFIAFLFGINYWRAILLISIGIAGAGLIITFSWGAIMSLLHILI